MQTAENGVNNTLTIGICDDNALHLQAASDFVSAFCGKHALAFECVNFTNPAALLSAVRRKTIAPQIVILDIEMDELDGITLAKTLNAVLPACRIIFFTSYVEYAPDVYEAEHIWFVVKSRAKEHFPKAMEKAVSSLAEETSGETMLMIHQNGSHIAVPTKHVLYLSVVARKTMIYCDETVYQDRRRPYALLGSLLGTVFVQCHQGYYINLGKVLELDHEEFILEGGIRLPLSRTFRESARAAYFAKYRV